MTLNRRRFLSAMGLTAGSLMLPSLSRRARASSSAPKRFLLLYTAQGTVPSRWAANPEGNPDSATWVSDMTGWSEGDFSDILRPLHGWRDQISVVDGLSLVSAEANGEGFRHERAQAHSLTGADVAWVGGFPFAGDLTIDQRIAAHVARADRYASLEVSVSNGLAYDGYGSVIYSGRNQPLPAIDDPRELWDRLFGYSSSEGDPVIGAQASLLDALAGRYAAVSSQLSSEDRQRLSLHQDLIRDLETRVVGLSSTSCDAVARASSYGDYETDFASHLQLITAALACDLTRVVSIQMGQLTTEQLGLGGGDVHADYAHDIYTSSAAEEAMTTYGAVHAAHFAQILAALEAIPEAGGTLLDSTVVVWMSEMADSWHGFDRYPVVVAGGGGALQLGRYIHYPRDVVYDGLTPTEDGFMGRPHQPLLTTLAQAMGVSISEMPITKVAGSDGSTIDCTGVLSELLG